MENLQALFYYATEGIIIADAKGVIVNANPSAERIFGYAQNQLLNQKVEQLVPGRFKSTHEAHRDGFSRNPHPRAMGKNMDLYGIRADGVEFPIEISLSPFKENEESFVIAFVIDVSERKTQEENIKRLNQSLETKVQERTKVLQEALIELEHSKEKLSKALEKEKELNEMKSRFVSMASHEFRTPLSTILSSVSLISKYPTTEDDEKRQRHVQKIKSSVTNMTLILNDFLSEDRLEEGKVLINRVEFDLRKLCLEIIYEMNGLKKSDQKIVYTHTGKDIVFSDTQIVKNILINLISNAIKFTDEKKSIEIKIDVTKELFVLEVSDQGIGIPKDEQANLFTRFFRAKNVTNIQGTGLGLSIVSKYIEMLNGSLAFESELNVGTTFTIKLPNV